MAKKLTSKKAREILHDKSVHGHPLTDKQRRFFGAIAGGAPIKAQDGKDIIPDKGLIPLPEYKPSFLNPYGYSFSPEANVNVYGLGVEAQHNINDRLNLHGGLNTESVKYPGGSQMFMKPKYNVGLTYRFENGGWLDKYDEGGQLCPPGFVKDTKGNCVVEGLNTNRSTGLDVIGTDPVQKIKQDVIGQEINNRNIAASKRTFIGPAREKTIDEQKRTQQLKEQYAATHPYAKLDESGDLTRRQWDRNMEGVADKYTTAAGIDKGMEHAANAMEAAGYITALGELTALGIKALNSGTLSASDAALLEGAQNLTSGSSRGILGKISDKFIYPIKYRKQIAQLESQLGKSLETLNTPEGRKRLKDLGINPEEVFSNPPSITSDPTRGSQYSPNRNTINVNMRDINKTRTPQQIIEHEQGHNIQGASRASGNNSMTVIDENAQLIDLTEPKNLSDLEALTHLQSEQYTGAKLEGMPYLREMRQDMLEKGFIKNQYDQVDPAIMEKYLNSNSGQRFKNIIDKSNTNYRIIPSLLNQLPVAAGVVAGTAALQKQRYGGTLQEYQENYNNNTTSFPPGFVGMGNDTTGRNYSPAWGGQFAMGGSLPGTVGFTYARTHSPAPSEGPYAKKTLPSAQNGLRADSRTFPTPYSSEFMDKLQQDYNEFYAAPKDYQDDRYDAYYHKLIDSPNSPFMTNLNVDEGPVWKSLLTGEIQHVEKFPNNWQKRLDKGKAKKEDFKFYPNYINEQHIGEANAARLASYLSTKPKSIIEANPTPIIENKNGGMTYYQHGLDWKPKTISKNGSVIEDDMGQWAHPGKITKINSNQITMKGVPYPVLGISDEGDTKMMYPEQEYTFKGKTVTEYPQNKKNGGWLDKYN